MKWLIAAAGRGTRLNPTTLHINKHLLPVASVSMIQRMHAFTALHKADSVHICVNKGEASAFEKEMNASPYEVPFDIFEQSESGVAAVVKTALHKGVLTETEPFVLALGDQFFTDWQEVFPSDDGCHLFTVQIPAKHASGYGILDKLTLNVVEKPNGTPDSQRVFAVVGLYSFPKIAKAQVDSLNPSARGELEIASLINEVKVSAVRSVRGEWCDMGTWGGIRAAEKYIEAVKEIDASR